MLNNCFSSILLTKKKKKEKYLTSKRGEAKVRAISSKNVFVIIWSYWLNLCFFRIRIGIWKDNLIKKEKGNLSKGIANNNGDGRANNLYIKTTNANGDKRAKNLCKSITEVERNRMNNLDIGIINIDKAEY